MAKSTNVARVSSARVNESDTYIILKLVWGSNQTIKRYKFINAAKAYPAGMSIFSSKTKKVSKNS